jgi:hypothetical protein
LHRSAVQEAPTITEIPPIDEADLDATLNQINEIARRQRRSSTI